ncbi:MAG: hypothetical protein HQ511_03400 [Rhodospirillales bacterium]|nr:hypothetical protein [Rhodospirillales bacterium]
MAVPYLGVVSESFVPALRDQFTNLDGKAISLEPREMIDLATRHLAPMTIVRVMGSPHTHPSIAAYWPVRGQGFLHRLTSRELFALDTAKIELTQHFYGANIESSAEYYLAENSDDMFMLSIGQLTKYIGELIPNRPLLDLDMAASAVKPQNLSPLVWETCNRPIELKIRKDDEPAWTRARRESAKFMRRMLVTREMLLLRDAMRKNTNSYFSSLLSTAIFVTGLVETWRYKRPVTVFSVADDAIREHHRIRALDIGRQGQEHRLLKAAKNHVIPGYIEASGGSTIETFGGATLDLDYSGAEGIFVNGAKVRDVIEVGENRLCILDKCLFDNGIE